MPVTCLNGFRNTVPNTVRGSWVAPEDLQLVILDEARQAREPVVARMPRLHLGLEDLGDSAAFRCDPELRGVRSGHLEIHLALAAIPYMLWTWMMDVFG